MLDCERGTLSVSLNGVSLGVMVKQGLRGKVRFGRTAAQPHAHHKARMPTPHSLAIFTSLLIRIDAACAALLLLIAYLRRRSIGWLSWRTRETLSGWYIASSDCRPALMTTPAMVPLHPHGKQRRRRI